MLKYCKNSMHIKVVLNISLKYNFFVYLIVCCIIDGWLILFSFNDPCTVILMQDDMEMLVLMSFALCHYNRFSICFGNIWENMLRGFLLKLLE